MSIGQLVKLVDETDSELGWVSAAFWLADPRSPSQGGIRSGGRDSDALGGTGRVNSRQRKAKSILIDSNACPPVLQCWSVWWTIPF